MKAWYDDIDCATLQRIKAYSAFNDATSKNLMIQTMYEYREKEIKDFKKTNHELADLCIQRKKHIKDLEKENAELKEKLAGAERTRDNLVQLGFPTFQSCKEYAELIEKMKCCGNCGKWENCEKDEMFSQDICGDWELER